MADKSSQCVYEVMDKYYFSVGSLHSYSVLTEDRYCASLFKDGCVECCISIFIENWMLSLRREIDHYHEKKETITEFRYQSFNLYLLFIPFALALDNAGLRSLCLQVIYC